MEDFLREAACMKEFDHPNVMRLLGESDSYCSARQGSADLKHKNIWFFTNPVLLGSFAQVWGEYILDEKLHQYVYIIHVHQDTPQTSLQTVHWNYFLPKK